MLQRAETAATVAGVNASRAFFERCFASEVSDGWLVAHVDEDARCVHLARYPARQAAGELPTGGIIADAARISSAGVVIARRQERPEVSSIHDEAEDTRHLARLAEALEVTVLDHLVFAGGDCASMRRMGLL